MKILVTGKHGYIAKSFADHAKEVHSIDLISLRDNAWRHISFAGYDTLLHTAGLVHMRETKRNQYDYYIINRDLTLEIAQKAKKDGVRQFIFLSSLSVYHLTNGAITINTPAAPKTHYGRSKLAAETMLAALADDTFTVTILRTPMVYGPNCPGNFTKLCQLIKKAPFFPNYPNARDMVYIKNLCAHIEAIIISNQGGIIFPRDPAPISTREMAAAVAKAQGKKLTFTQTFNPPITWLMPHVKTIAKLFGSLTLDSSLPSGGGVDLIHFPDSIVKSVNYGANRDGGTP